MAPERRNLASLVEDFDRLRSDIAIVAPQGLRRQSATYPALALLCRRFAAELERRGISKGERVILCGDNGVNWVAAFFGCVLRGVLPVPLDAGSARDFLRRVEHEVTPRLVIANAEKTPFFTSPAIPLESLAEEITRESAGALADLGEEDPLQIVFTSGTTGDPKGVVHTHRNVLASLRPIEREMGKYLKYERIFHPIRFLHTLPLSHVFGQFMGLWIPPLLGAEIHFESNLIAEDLIRYVRSGRISVLCAVPRVLSLLRQRLLERFPGLEDRLRSAAGISALRRWIRFRDIHAEFGFKFWAFVCGGASLTSESEQFWGGLGFAVVQGYGMTETTALVSLNHPFKPAQGTIGRVLPGREVKLGEDGEVLVRGDTISNTVWQNGKACKRESEWFATGDLAKFDEQGNLRFRGRKKDVIVTAAGLNIHPDDLESALKRQHGVRDAAVIEVQSAHGPEPLAVLLAGPDLDPAAAIAQANGELAEFQQMRRWHVWPDADLPRTSTGKILKRELAARLAGGATASMPDPMSLDSLGRVELQARLEQQYGITLDDAALQQLKSAEDVRAVVARASASPSAHPPGAPRHLYPKWPWNALMQGIRVAFLEVIALPLLRFLAGPKRVRLTEQFPSGPALIVANHVTSYDAPFVLFALPGQVRRRCAVAMSGEMLLDFRRARNQGNWFLNLLAPAAYLLMTALFNVFPLPQYSGFRRSFRHAGEAADRGYSVLVFPEGRRAEDETGLAFMKGAGLLWKELGIPAIAVRIEGLGEIKRTQSNWFRSGRVTVTLRKVLQLDPQLTPEALTEELRHGVFGDGPPS